MKIAASSVSLLAALATRSLVRGECVDGGFFLDFDGACTPASVLEAYEDQVFSAAGATGSGCATSAEDDLAAKLGAAGLADRQALCDLVYDSQEQVPFEMAARRGKHFDEMFFNGRTDWQEEVETLYETDDYTATSVLREDAEQVNTFYRGTAQGRRVEWPNTLTNFQSEGLPTCSTNAAMCCWPKDRQANDNNGNCAKPYDENCVNKDPADNTNLCYVDLERGNQSTGFGSSEGFISFPGDNNEGEGAIHCHGLAWSNDANDHTARYKANNLFFVSMYDHMHQRGYVRNVPGAPMCGCVEQMPTVSRSDCTQVDLDEKIEISYNADTKSFKTKMAYVDVDFNSCRGINNRNNDLWAYSARLFYQGDITEDQFGELGRVITNTGCSEATNYALNEKGMTPGYDHDVEAWTNVAGRDSMHLHDPYGHRAFAASLVPGTGHYGIIFRACRSCIATHMKIFYRRITEVPDDLNLLDNILYRKDTAGGRNVWNQDFTLHSTYDDAVSGADPWKCPNNKFNYGATFYGECSPNGNRVRDQYSRFNSNHKKDVAYFVNKAESDILDIVPTTAIKGRDWAGGIALESLADGTIYMTGSGRDIWWYHDDFNYMSQAVGGDHTVIVHVGQLSSPDPHEWSKSGIMFRSSLDSNAAHYGVVLTGRRGVCPVGRLTDGAHATGFNNCVESGATEAWLKVERRIDTFTAYYGTGEPGNVVWTLVHSRVYEGFPEEYEVGLAVSSARYWAQEAVFSHYEVDQYNFPSMAPSVSSMPTNLHGVAAWEIFNGLGGNRISTMTGSASYPDSPTRVDHLTTGLEIPRDTMSNYGSRLWTYVRAPVSGAYTFWIASDDQGELWLSTTSSPDDVVKIAYINGWSSYRQWDKFGSQKSAPIELVAGQSYYLLALHKEGQGGDNLSVGWAIPGGTGAVEVIGPQHYHLQPPAETNARRLRGGEA